ncbi:WD40-repeat-containing domain protein [Fomitopsis serialis]|uniref:WD40-repeat-containing domain protein n=1 Tax=Fomitopsis serialis TaxID=139415 RepID=UPI002008A883|nr:WD40-repeat-containing domain protein [Neoantrodia serialis]KAH9921145.1 WD40-repeat-containing domain protein [Neoantrodia serialis]
MTMESAIGLSRSHSVSEAPPTPPPVPESAITNMRGDKIVVDFSVAEEDWGARVCPVSWSVNNLLLFGRGSRVHYKNLSANEAIGQLCKFREDQGNLRLVECGGKDYPNLVAVCSANGHIQLWDLAAKKMVSKWTTKSTTAMQWNGPILTVGGERGSIRQFDTRVSDTTKMREQVKKTMRHQAKISSLSWNIDGKFLASGDESGQVHIWDPRQGIAPLEKIQHVGVITALAWCPWQPKTLATGDSALDGTGTVRIWNVNGSVSSNHPDRLELDAQITSLHFSPHCKELLSTHGPGKTVPGHSLSTPIDPNTCPDEHVPSRIANSVLVHAFPSFRRVATMVGAKANVAGSILSPNGQRIVLAVPEESKLKVWDVMMSACSIR